MSLVNEALKKARLEAARQQAERKGLPPPAAAAYPEPRRGRRALPILALLAVAVAVLLFYAGRRSVAPEAATASPAPGPAATDGSAASVPPPQPETEAETGAGLPSAPDPAPAPATDRTAAADRGAPPAPAPESEPVPAAPVASTPPVRIALEDRPLPDPGARREVPAEPVTRVFVRTAELPDGRLELGGIAWSGERPFALINGEVVGPGDQVDAYTVVRILPQSVQLRGDSGSLELKLK